MKKIKNWNLDNKGFILKKPVLGRSYKNYLSNGDYGLCIDQFGTGYSVSLKPTVNQGRCYITHHGFSLTSKGRYVYCTDKSDNAVWNPSYGPAKTELDNYECCHGFGSTRFTGERKGIQCVSRHFLPVRGCFELWYISLSNQSNIDKNLSVYTQLEFLLQDRYPVSTPFYSWYTDSIYDEKQHLLKIYSRKPAERNMLGFCFSLTGPDGYEAGLFSFYGQGDAQFPEAVCLSTSSCTPSGGEAPVAAFRYDVSLKAGETRQFALCIGEGQDNLDEAMSRFTNLEAIEKELAASNKQRTMELEPQGCFFQESEFFERNTISFDKQLWLSRFLPNQIRQQALGMIRFEYRGYRDVAQDAMGLCQYDLDAAHSLILDLAIMQHADGRCLRQFCTLSALHDERDFRDLPFWLVLAVARYVKAGGSRAILYEKRPFLDDSEETDLLDHIRRGLQYVLRFGSHNLLQIGVGDWNDALSDLGPEGVSVWLNQIAYLCLDELETLLVNSEERSLLGFDISKTRERLYAGVDAAWTGDWFLRGYTSTGHKIGSGDRLFLLPQAWFTISGMAVRDPERAAKAMDSMIQHLDHPDGLLKCYPAFTDFDPTVGNISALSPGVAENYAVYNHAFAFAIYALCMAGRNKEALRYFERMLPFNKDTERTRTEPHVLVNYYNGGYYPAKAGRGGIAWMTGTANWLAMIVFDFKDILFSNLAN